MNVCVGVGSCAVEPDGQLRSDVHRADFSDAPEITLEPMADETGGGADWSRLAAGHFETLGRAAVAFRSQLGLPGDRPIVMTGHQAEWWHPGILAKAIAAEVTASRLEHAATAWFIVDQDANDDGTIRLPCFDREDRLRAVEWTLWPDSAELTRAGVPTARRRAAGSTPAVLDDGARWAVRTLTASGALERIASTVDSHAGAGSRAEQVARSVLELAMPALGHARGGSQARWNEPPTLVLASGLGATDLFRELVGRMLAEPRRCVELFNRAAAAHPKAGIAPLALTPTAESDEQIELPLWHLPTEPGSVRRRVTVREVRRLFADRPGELAPRAVLATGLMRLAGADLFIHGLGGRLYDPISDQWLTDWLGLAGSLAPTAVASATLRLEIEFPQGRRPAPPEDIARIRWLRHHARHDPATLGDSIAAERKAALLGQLQELRRHRRRDASARVASRDAYRELQELLGRVRRDRSEQLRRFDARAAEAAARAEESRLAADRTWFFGLYEPEQIRALACRIRAELSAGA